MRRSIEYPYEQLKYNIEKYLDESGRKAELVEKMIKVSKRHRTHIHKYRGTHISDKYDMPYCDAIAICRVLEIPLENLLNSQHELLRA